MKMNRRVKAQVLAELKSIYAEVKECEECDEKEIEIPAELKVDAQYDDTDLTLDNANPMVATSEDDIESLELEDEEKGEEGELTACDEIEDEDKTINISDIIKSADDDGNIKLSCIKSMCELPDDKKTDDVVSCKTASIEKPGIEDEIGDEANGGDPSTSELKKIISSLDDFSSKMEKEGNKRFAYRLDRVANQLDLELKNLK